MSKTANTTPGTALITGASSGIGAVYADRLARRGHDLILVARNQERLDAVAKRIREQTGRSVKTVSADLADAKGVAQVADILRRDESIDTLVNNAGFGSISQLLESDVARMEEMIAVNVTALTRLTYAAAPAFVKRQHGTIVNISSIVAIAPEILNGVYGATKGYVLNLTHSLQHELSTKGVRVQAVLPGATATEFWHSAGAGGVGNLPAAWVMTAENMVDASLAGLDAGEVVTIPALQDGAAWTDWEAARRAMSQNLSATKPAARYLA